MFLKSNNGGGRVCVLEVYNLVRGSSLFSESPSLFNMHCHCLVTQQPYIMDDQELQSRTFEANNLVQLIQEIQNAVSNLSGFNNTFTN